MSASSEPADDVPAPASAADMAEQAAAGTAIWAVALMGLVILASLIVSSLLLAGGIQMVRGKAYALSVVASVLAMLPCHVIFPLSVAFGIWSLCVLLSADVKQAMHPERFEPAKP